MASWQEAERKVEEIGNQLTAYDFGDYLVHVVNVDDGAVFTYPDAFVLKWEDWFLVFTEHYLYHRYHEDDHFVVQYKHADIQALEDWKPCPDSVKYFASRTRGIE
jgi:hypothetical protein